MIAMEEELREDAKIDISIDEGYECVEIEFINENGDTDYEYIGDMYKSGGKWYIYPEIRIL